MLTHEAWKVAQKESGKGGLGCIVRNTCSRGEKRNIYKL